MAFRAIGDGETRKSVSLEEAMGGKMKNVKSTIKGMVVATLMAIVIGGGLAIADPAAIVETSPAGRMEEPGEVSSYLYGSRTRVNLPEDILAELNEWAQAYTTRLEEWNAEDGEAFDAYYGGLEEGFSYAYSMILARLGYIDGTATSETLQNMPEEWEGAQEFFAWERAGFGDLN